MATGNNSASEPRWLALFNPDVRGKLLNSEEELVAALDNPDVRGLVTYEMLRRAALSLGTIARLSSHFEHKFEASGQGIAVVPVQTTLLVSPIRIVLRSQIWANHHHQPREQVQQSEESTTNILQDSP